MDRRPNREFRTKFTKEELIDKIKEAKYIKQYMDDTSGTKWLYPSTDDNNGNNAFMQFSFDCENKSGIVIFIPVEDAKRR